MTSPTYHGKVTLLKLALSVVVVVVLIATGVLLSNKKDKESVDALDANPYLISDTSDDTTDPTEASSEANLVSECDDEADCDDQDERANQPSSNAGISAPATSDNDAQSQTDFAIEEEGIPAVDERPAKTN